jgi:hypothetical protein
MQIIVELECGGHNCAIDILSCSMLCTCWIKMHVTMFVHVCVPRLCLGVSVCHGVHVCVSLHVQCTCVIVCGP